MVYDAGINKRTVPASPSDPCIQPNDESLIKVFIDSSSDGLDEEIEALSHE